MTSSKGFLPSTDSGIINGMALAGQDISYDSMVQHVTAVKNIIHKDPNDLDVFAFVNGGNTGNVFVMLKDRKDRPLSADQVSQELQPKLLAVPGIQAFLQNPPPFRSAATTLKAPTRSRCRIPIKLRSTTGPPSSSTKCARCPAS